MRWFWMDRFVAFESGRRAVAKKAFTISEIYLDEYTPGQPTIPHSLIIEGLAQCGGLLVGEHGGFKERVVLAKISRAVFHTYVVPGDMLTMTTTVEDIKSDGAIVQATVHIEERLQAEVELVFAHLDDRFPPEIFSPLELMRMLRLYRLYDVGVDEDGNSLKIPQYLLDAEKKYIETGAES